MTSPPRSRDLNNDRGADTVTVPTPMKRPHSKSSEPVKVLIIGDSAVGKTTLLMRYCENRFDISYIATIGVDFKTKTVPMGEKNYMMQIWDTAGHERFRTITSSLYRDCMGIVLVYSIEDENSFYSVKQWVHEITQNVGTNVSIVLVGNKSDLVDRRAVQTQSGEELAELFQLPFFETSAKTAHNVEAVFMTLLLAIIDSGQLEQLHTPPCTSPPASVTFRIPATTTPATTNHNHNHNHSNTHITKPALLAPVTPPGSVIYGDTGEPLIEDDDRCCW
ncbi:GTP-binding protein yptV1 [Pelomyxa schiedti]|nr:GTP-binding protein yptV1 [Pelomyxa schiedti]